MRPDDDDTPPNYRLPPRVPSPSLLSTRAGTSHHQPATFYMAPPPHAVPTPLTKGKIKKKDEKMVDSDYDDDEIQVIAEQDEVVWEGIVVKKEEPTEEISLNSDNGGEDDVDEIVFLEVTPINAEARRERRNRKREKYRRNNTQLFSSTSHNTQIGTGPSSNRESLNQQGSIANEPSSQLPLTPISTPCDIHSPESGTIPFQFQRNESSTSQLGQNVEFCEILSDEFENIQQATASNNTPDTLNVNNSEATAPITSATTGTYPQASPISPSTNTDIPISFTPTPGKPINFIVGGQMVSLTFNKTMNPPSSITPQAQFCQTGDSLINGQIDSGRHNVDVSHPWSTPTNSFDKDPVATTSTSSSRVNESNTNLQNSSSRGNDKHRHRQRNSTSRDKRHSSRRHRQRNSTSRDKRHSSRRHRQRNSTSRDTFTDNHRRDNTSTHHRRNNSTHHRRDDHQRDRRSSHIRERSRYRSTSYRRSSHRSAERRSPPLVPLFDTPSSLLRLLTKCSTCNIYFPSRTAGVQHQKKAHQLKYCPVCFQLLSCKGNKWKDHLLLYHAVSREIEKAKCPFNSCLSTNPLNFEGIYLHIGKQHLVPEEEREQLNFRVRTRSPPPSTTNPILGHRPIPPVSTDTRISPSRSAPRNPQAVSSPSTASSLSTDTIVAPPRSTPRNFQTTLSRLSSLATGTKVAPPRSMPSNINSQTTSSSPNSLGNIQTEILDKMYYKSQCPPGHDELNRIAAQFGVSPSIVNVYFVKLHKKWCRSQRQQAES